MKFFAKPKTKTGEQQIFKIQKPLATNNEDMLYVLAYNTDQSIELYIPLEPNEIDALFGADLKQYWLAHAILNIAGNMLVLDKKVAEQDW